MKFKTIFLLMVAACICTASQQTIENADMLKAGTVKLNANFSELYGRLPVGTVVGTTDTQTLTAKRVTPRVVAIGYAASITPNDDTSDIVNVGTLIGNITVVNPSGHPTDGQTLKFRFEQDPTGGWVITWGTRFAFGTDITEALIPTGVTAKWEMVFQWHEGTSKYRCVGIARGF